MSASRPISHAVGILVFLGASLLARPAHAAGVIGANVRPFFSAGPSFPVDLGGTSRGFGMGFGLEAEQSSRVSVLFRVEWHWMQGKMDPAPYSYYTTPTSFELTTVSWSLGARAYLGTHGPARSYVDGGFGVRLVKDEYGVLLSSTAVGTSSPAKDEGLAMVFRLGLSSAPSGRAGFFLDSGIDLLVDNPDRNGLITARLGVLFP